MTKKEVPDHRPGCPKDTREEVQEERTLKARYVEAAWDLASPGCSRVGLEDRREGLGRQTEFWVQLGQTSHVN